MNDTTRKTIELALAETDVELTAVYEDVARAEEKLARLKDYERTLTHQRMELFSALRREEGNAPREEASSIVTHIVTFPIESAR